MRLTPPGSCNVIELVGADACDPFVKFWLEDAHDGLIKGRRARTVTRRGTLRPVWRSVREMGLQPVRINGC